MRVKRKKIEWVILAVAVIAIGVLAGASPEGTSRLVSVQQLPATWMLARTSISRASPIARCIRLAARGNLARRVAARACRGAPQRAGAGHARHSVGRARKAKVTKGGG